MPGTARCSGDDGQCDSGMPYGVHLVTAVCNSAPLKLPHKRESYLAPQILWQGMLAPSLQSRTSL